MFTIKRRYWDGSEAVSGPFEQVYSELVDGNGNRIGTGDYDRDSLEGRLPIIRVIAIRPDGSIVRHDPCSPSGPMIHQPKLWVMNEAGATVASYDMV